MEALHDDMGHRGKDRMLSLIRDRFYWPGMDKAVALWISQCGRRIRRKTPASSQRAPLISISTQFPLELVCIDFLTLEQSKGGHHNILVITELFTRFAQAIPTRNQTAKTTAQTHFDSFIVQYDIPQRIHSDQVANFESKVVKELCTLTGMKMSRTTSYHHMGNGMCERFNRTLFGMLRTMGQHQKSMAHVYNCTRHESTGVSPYFLIFGRPPRLPIDLAFGINKESKQPVETYLKNLRDRLTHAYQLATVASRNAQVHQKEVYEIKVRGAIIQKGDGVLVKQVYFDGKHKLSDTWKKVQYVVVDQANSAIPVFTVTREDGEGRTRIPHRNLLLPVGFISEQEIPLEKPKPVPRPRTRQQKSVAVQPSTSDDSTDDSTDESEVEYVLRPVDSESTLTENSVGPAHDISILSGDAHPEDIQVQELEIGSASDTAEVEDETPQDTE
jgi:transposase InsO family protein